MGRSFLLGVATRNFATPNTDDYADARAGPVVRIVPARAVLLVFVFIVALPSAFAVALAIRIGDPVVWTLVWLLLFGAAFTRVVGWFVVTGRTELVYPEDVALGDWVAAHFGVPFLVTPASQVVAKFHHHGRAVQSLQIALRNGNAFSVSPAGTVCVVRVTDRWARLRPWPSYEVRWADVHETVVGLLSALWDRAPSGGPEVVDRPALRGLAAEHGDADGERAIDAAVRMGLLVVQRRGGGFFSVTPEWCGWRRCFENEALRLSRERRRSCR